MEELEKVSKELKRSAAL
jgi:hypothetical protein